MLNQRFLRAFFLLSVLWPIARVSAQIPREKPAPLSPRVPSADGACSVEKSCADVAPAIIRSALGVSPLQENLRNLTDEIGGRVTGSPEADRAVGFAVEAFRRAGVDEVHTEHFTVPVGMERGPDEDRGSVAQAVSGAPRFNRLVAPTAGRGHHR